MACPAGGGSLNKVVGPVVGSLLATTIACSTRQNAENILRAILLRIKIAQLTCLLRVLLIEHEFLSRLSDLAEGATRGEANVQLPHMIAEHPEQSSVIGVSEYVCV